MSNLTLDVQINTNEPSLPSQAHFAQWAEAALPNNNTTTLTLRLVDKAESAQLNMTYRQKPEATNVLTFPAQAPAFLRGDHLGDIIICAPLVKEEAKIQNKSITAHWAHLVVHSVLHLLGYDHQNAEEAEHMESLEITILAQLGYPNPYGETITHDQ